LYYGLWFWCAIDFPVRRRRIAVGVRKLIGGPATGQHRHGNRLGLESPGLAAPSVAVGGDLHRGFERRRESDVGGASSFNHA